MVTVQASKELLGLIDQWADALIKPVAIVPKIVAEATAQGLAAGDCRELMESALSKRGLKKRQIYKLIPDEFKRIYINDENNATSAPSAHVEDSSTNTEDIAKLKAHFEAIQSEVKQLRFLLRPFKTATRIEIRGQTVPVILEIDPQSQRVLSAEINEAEARRLSQ